MKLERLQNEFTAHIRDPQNNAAPAGIEDRRMKIYRDLFFNNIRSLLSANFPVLHRIYSEADWDMLVRDFYASHRCHTPLFPEVAREFLRYLQDGRDERKGDPAFLLELAHYEWVEMALELDDRTVPADGIERDGDLLDGIPVLSPLVQVLSYRFPVHRIGPDYQPDSAPEAATHLLVWRNRDDDVRFMQLNDFSRLLFELMGRENTRSGRDLLKCLARDTGHPDPDRIVASGADLLLQLRDKGILLGARRDTDV